MTYSTEIDSTAEIHRLIMEIVRVLGTPSLEGISRQMPHGDAATRDAVRRLVREGYLRQKEDPVGHDWTYRSTRKGDHFFPPKTRSKTMSDMSELRRLIDEHGRSTILEVVVQLQQGKQYTFEWLPPLKKQVLRACAKAGMDVETYGSAWDACPDPKWVPRSIYRIKPGQEFPDVASPEKTDLFFGKICIIGPEDRREVMYLGPGDHMCHFRYIHSHIFTCWRFRGFVRSKDAAHQGVFFDDPWYFDAEGNLKWRPLAVWEKCEVGQEVMT